MSGYLRQSTASQVRTIGVFLDDTDFKTLENALTINNTDIVISKAGAADTTKNLGGATAHGAGGIYTLTWDATDTDTVGELFYSVKVAGALVVFGSYTVIEPATYDALFADAAPGPATPTNITAGTITTATNVTTVNGLAANVITAASMAADAGNEIADAVLDRNMATGTDSGSTTVRTPRQALRAIRNKWTISAGTLTVNKEDDITASWTSALTGTAGADPITTSDPTGP